MEVLQVIPMQVLLALFLPSLGHTDQTQTPTGSYIRHLTPGTELGWYRRERETSTIVLNVDTSITSVHFVTHVPTSVLFLLHFFIFQSLLRLLFYWITSLKQYFKNYFVQHVAVNKIWFTVWTYTICLLKNNR